MVRQYLAQRRRGAEKRKREDGMVVIGYRLSVISYQGSVVCDLEGGCPPPPVYQCIGEAKGRGGEGERL
jgi:hypothetical protein